MPRRAISIGPVLSPLPVPPDPAVAPVWAAIERDLGLLAPPLILHSAVPGLLAAAWAVFREAVVVEAGLPRPVKEAIGVAVSAANRCPYCVDAHAVGLHAAGAGAVERALAKNVERALAQNVERVLAQNVEPVLAQNAGAPGTRRLEPATRAWNEWAAASRWAGPPPLPPATPEARAQGIATAVSFHYINRMVTVLLPETLLPVRRAWLRRPVLALAGRRLSAPARRRHEPGEALALLPPAPGPGPEWARAAPAAAAALSALGAAVDAAAGALPEPARSRAAERIAAWDGTEPPFGTAWLDEPAAGLPPPAAAAVRLALATAFAPHRVGEAEIAALRRHHPGDAPLLGVLAWASYRTAETIAGRLARSPSL